MTAELSPTSSDQPGPDNAGASVRSDQPSLVVEMLPEAFGRLLMEGIGMLPFPLALAGYIAIALLLVVVVTLPVSGAIGTGEPPPVR